MPVAVRVLTTDSAARRASAYLLISAELGCGHLNILCRHFISMRLPSQGPFAAG
jgi:hypothetical protein